MKNLFQRVRDLLAGRRPLPGGESSATELEATFKARYHSFKLLLSANNKALDLMAEMEEALSGDRVFGMAFIRARSTALVVSVYQMVKNLDQLAPGKYEGLFERLRVIQDEINEILAEKVSPDQDQMVLPLEVIDKDWADQAGAKMANLGELKNRLGFSVPPGFVISAAAYYRFFKHNDLQHEINRLVQTATLDRMDQLYALSSDIQQLIVRATLPEDLSASIKDAYRRLEQVAGPGVNVSLRSSALGEDTAEASFAGQYRSQLNVRPENLLQAYKEVVASKYTPQAIHYRLVRGLRDDDVAMCVGCMSMVRARAGGVAYSRNPLDIRDLNLYINSAWGLPKSVVDGAASADLFVVRRSDPPSIINRRISHKDSQLVCDPSEGVSRLAITGREIDRPSLEDDQVLNLASISIRLEEHYGSPQDIEWTLAQDGSVLILQCRPLRPVQPGPDVSREYAQGAEVLLSGGVRASPGAASGPVFWVHKDSDALRFPQGSVLTVSQPLPRWAALLGRAAGVIAEQGSQAGHLATVAREYGLPALFNLAEAAGNLRSGEVITLDADGLAVYRGRIESLLNDTGRKKNLMAGSPVYQTLQGVLERIAPLTMLDPDAPSFKASHGQTLHDITRFCHEKSVQEMFSFGKDHHFPERSSKQLFYKVPMQWWVINLDDGFHQEVQGKRVGLDNIASIPMMAIWEGMTAVPWEGPPAVSGSGLASVLFQATTNPALASPFKSPYANRNYFMISRNFMNLQPRFGFHFCTVEALVGERPPENYISFSFRGGAADFDRRSARVHFLAKVLEDYGFRMEIKDDTALARLEGLEQEVMAERLKLVGYLIMHTRQLDMIMANPASVQYYNSKIKKDLQSLIVN